MPIASPLQIRDPLQIFLGRRGAPHPVPLFSTDFDVTIDGGLAIVTTTRLFRNTEEIPIEATLTFPMPVHATLFDLRVTIAGRALVARAQSHNTARATYEDAIGRGKSAVLHEEVLRGIHMLSVANIPAGEAIEVRTQWATTLAVVSATGHLRIPVTVGDVYGRSPLAESDDLKTGGAPLSGTLTVQASGAQVRLVGGCLDGGKAKLLLNHPIDLVIDDWRPGPVRGTAADGRAVSLTLQPAPDRNSALNIAILVDHSGSMQHQASSGMHASSKHDHAVAALRKLAGALSAGDTVDLWEFATHTRQIGVGKLDQLVAHLSAPSGGTEIGTALATVIKGSAADGVLLITDGKSHALDVQGLARMGRRISVVLVGEDSLEANVGHLAALTGGDIFVSAGADLDGLLEAALGGLRCGRHTSGKENFRRSGMMVTVSHGASPSTSAQSDTGRAVAATAASFLLPTLSEAEAMDLALRAGLVSHLTSLVLVDEAGATQETLPGQRPVALPPPAFSEMVPIYFSVASVPAPVSRRRSGRHPLVKSENLPSSKELAHKIDWASDPTRLLAGDLTQLAEALQEHLKTMAQRDGMKQAAATLGLTALMLAIALLAHQAGQDGNRAAARIAHRLFGRTSPEQIRKLATLIAA